MFSIGPIQFSERVNKAFERTIKRKNSEYFVQEQLRNKSIVTGVFKVLQKVLLKDPIKWKELLDEKVYREVDKYTKTLFSIPPFKVPLKCIK
jgi:hypothetical protein